MKLKLTLMTFFLALFVSCSKSNEELVEGTWNATSIKINGTESINSIAAYTNVKLTFNPNHNFTASSNSGTWSVSGDVINIQSSPLNYSYTIKKLDDTHLETSTSSGATTIEHTFSK